jgi:hypothetical protein
MEKARVDISAAEARTADYITFDHSRWSETVWRKPFSRPLAEPTPHLPKDCHSVAGGEGPESSLSWVFTGLNVLRHDTLERRNRACPRSGIERA